MQDIFFYSVTHDSGSILKIYFWHMCDTLDIYLYDIGAVQAAAYNNAEDGFPSYLSTFLHAQSSNPVTY